MKTLSRWASSALPTPTPKTIPWFLLLATLLTYGALAPALGFHQDDWYFVYYYVSRGLAGIAEFMYYDGHPLSTWSYALGFILFGTNAIAWQFFSLGLRWLAAVAIWKTLHQLWQNNLRQTFLAAVLFLIYPTFTLQAQAVVYFEVWLSYAFLFFSFYYAGRGIRGEGKTYHAWGMVAKIGHIFTSEYVTGIEFIRPLLIWQQLPSSLPTRQRLQKTLWYSLPYLLINFGYIIWRVFLHQSPRVFTHNSAGDPTYPSMLAKLATQPLAALWELSLNTLQDLSIILATSWLNLAPTYLLEPLRPVNLLLAALLLLGFGFIVYTLTRLTQNPVPEAGWQNLPVLLTGVAILLAGLIPYYVIGYFLHIKLPPWNGRVSLGSLVGAAILLIALAQWLIPSRRWQNLFFAALVGLGMAWQAQNQNDFRYSWEQQKNFYRQLTWRAPSLQKGTALIATHMPAPLMSREYTIGFAINSVYTQPAGTNLPYWFFLSKINLPGKEAQLAQGIPLEYYVQSVQFEQDSRQSLIVNFKPDKGQCLWVLRPQDANAPGLSEEERQLSQATDLSRILNTPAYPFLSQIGAEDLPQTWCYYYQKGELARQNQNWSEALRLLKEAQEQNLRPRNGFEYSPFIEALLGAGEWDAAVKLTREASQISPGMPRHLCGLWREALQDSPRSPAQEKAQNKVFGMLGCK